MIKGQAYAPYAMPMMNNGVAYGAGSPGPVMIKGQAYAPYAMPMMNNGVAYGAGSPGPVMVGGRVDDKDDWKKKAWAQTQNKTNTIEIGNTKMNGGVKVSAF
jgi:hypothetical protein